LYAFDFRVVDPFNKNVWKQCRQKFMTPVNINDILRLNTLT